MENNINKTEVKKGRFNAFDALVIILVLAVIFSAFYILDPFGLFSAGTKENVTLRYTVEFKNVDDDFKDNINVGDTVHNATSNSPMGKVISVTVKPAFEWVEGETAMEQKPIAGKSNVFVTIEVECVREKGIGYLVNGYNVVVGIPMDLRFSNFVGSGECIAITEAK